MGRMIQGSPVPQAKSCVQVDDEQHDILFVLNHDELAMAASTEARTHPPRCRENRASRTSPGQPSARNRVSIQLTAPTRPAQAAYWRTDNDRCRIVVLSRCRLGLYYALSCRARASDTEDTSSHRENDHVRARQWLSMAHNGRSTAVSIHELNLNHGHMVSVATRQPAFWRVDSVPASRQRIVPGC